METNILCNFHFEKKRCLSFITIILYSFLAQTRVIMFSKQPVHTNALMRLGLPSTPIRSAFSSKMHGFAVKTLLKVDQNQNKNISYQYGRSKTNETENHHRIYRRRMCLKHVHRVQLMSQCAILSFSNVSVWTFENASKR